MRNLLILFLLIYFAKAQDIEPNQKQFNVNGVLKYLNANDTNNQQKHFLKGWHWDSKKKINEALLMNQVDLYQWDNDKIFQDSAMLIIKPYNYSHANDGKIFNARSIQYAPYLQINTSNPDDLVIRQGDTLKEIFGFKYINGNIETNHSNPNFYKLIIDRTKQNSIILDNPWPQDFFSKQSVETDSYINNNYLCREMYISINLSRIGNPIGNDTNLLKIELPFSEIDTTISGIDTLVYNLIKFDMIPSPNINDTIQNARGIYRNLIKLDSVKTRCFYIKRNMLPIDNSNITVSAHFIMNGDTTDFNREVKLFSPPKAPSIYKIDSLGIRITYLGQDSLAINWVRFETPHAQKFLRGYYDNVIINDIQDVLDRFTVDSNQFKQNNPQSNLFRFNNIIEGFPMNWQAERYLNKLIGNIGTNEVGNYYTKHYERYVNPPDRWFGLVGLGNVISQPYTKSVIPWKFLDLKNIGLINGYLGIDTTYSGHIELNYDQKKAKYEEYLLGTDLKFLNAKYFKDHPNEMSEYLFALNGGYWKGSSLGLVETYVYHNFIKSINVNMIYSHLNWWSQIFTHTWWKPLNEIIDVPYSNYGLNSRPWTGEEFKYYTILPIILGAKGVIYDGAVSAGGRYNWDSASKKDVWSIPKPAVDDYYYTIPATQSRLDSLNGWDYVKDDSVGADFYSLNSEHYKLDSLIYYPLNEIAQTLGVPTNRIYMGRKSTRIEMRKLHDWITINDSVLMNLRLQSYFAHGYKIWENFHPKYNNNPIRNIVKLDYVKTRKLWNNGFLVPKDEYEPNESSFFDITLLSHTSDPNMNNNFFIGYANRRTNPLILEYDTLKFYSTAEFDEFVVKDSSKGINGTFFPKSYWQYQFWRRAGSRELSIQFAGTIPQDPLYEIFPYYYKIQELGVGTNYFNQDSGFYWTDSLYYHKIDTTVMKYGALKSRLLPGQGKILSIIDGNIIDKICPPIPIYSCEELLKDIRFYVVRDQNIWGDSCKYDLSLIIPQGWQFDSTDIRTIIRTDNSPAHLTFNSTFNYNINQQDSTVYVRLDSIPVNQEIVFGSFYTTCPEHFTVKFQVGKRIMEIFPGCTYDGNFEGDCTCGYQMRSSTNCCDNIDLYAAETTEDGKLSGKFNVFAKQNTTDCAVCEISLVRKFDTKVLAKLTKDMKEKKLNLANFANIGKISMDKSNGRSKDTLFAYIKDKDGKLICKKEIVLETLDWKQGKIIEINEPTESNTTDLSIQYYPNPVEELFNIEVNSEICKKVKVKLLTLKSEELFNIEVKTNALNQFSTEGISNGVYFLKIEDCESDKFIIKKIVIKK